MKNEFLFAVSSTLSTNSSRDEFVDNFLAAPPTYPPPSVPAILKIRSTRYLLAVILSITLIGGAAAKEKKHPPTKKSTTWGALIKHVMKNGADRPLTAPLTKNAGFTADLVQTKAMRIEADSSLDKMSHTVYVAYTKDKDGTILPSSILLSKSQSRPSDAGPTYELFSVRCDLQGNSLNANRSKGLKGRMESSIVDVAAASVKADADYERKYFLETIKLEQLSTK